MPQPLVGGLVANRYRIVAELGRGAMGAVYRAVDTLVPGPDLALKCMAVAGGITPELALMFKEEFRAMAKLRHPNTIAVHDFGQLDAETHFLTMELVEGQSLDEVANGRPMPLERVYAILVQLLQALEFIHSRLYVHRDIKSQNIRLKPDGTLKLMDFGLMSQLGLPTKGGTLRGSPGYVAPEIIRGGVVDASTDLYAVGCLAYELLTGTVPFTGALMQVVRAHVATRPEPLARHRAELPVALERLVMKLLEKEQTERYRSAAAVLDDLAAIAGLAVTRPNVAQKKSYLTSVGLVAREAELAQLTAGLEACRKGRAASFYIGAPAGVGKSRLAQEALLQATLSELPVAFGQSLESGMAPYEPLVHALRALLPLTRDEELADVGPVLAHLFPELAARGFAKTPGADTQVAKAAIHDALVVWLKRLTARQPIVWCMDDLQWADPSSLEAFNYCQAALSGQAFLAIAAFRNDEVGSGSPLWYPVEDGAATYLELRPFRAPEIAALVRAMLHDVQMTEAFEVFLYDTTAGNAFFLTEILRYLIDEQILTQRDGRWHFPAETAGLVIPGSVEATVVRRLRLLGERARELAGVASVLGRFQDRGMLRAVAQLDDETLFQLVDELVAGQFLIHDAEHYTFPHDRVREALYADVPAERRQLLHQRCGEFLEAGAATAAHHINELAHHFGRGQDRAKAYTYLRRAGDEAARLGLTGNAITYWKEAEQALAVLELPDKEALQVEIWHRIGTQGFDFWPELAIEAFDRELAALEARGDVDAVAAAIKGRVAALAGAPEAERAAALAAMSTPTPYVHDPAIAPDPTSWLPRIVETYAFLGAAYGFNGKPAKGLPAVERARALMPFRDTPLAAVLDVAFCVPAFPAGRLDEIRAALTRARGPLIERIPHEDINQLPSVLATRVGYCDFYNACGMGGDRPDDAVLRLGLAFADGIGWSSRKNALWTRHAVWYALTGRFDEAMHHIELITQNCRRIGAPPYLWSVFCRIHLRWQRGEFPEALGELQQATRLPSYGYDALSTQFIQVLHGQVLAELGRTAEALTQLQAVEQVARAEGMALPLMAALTAIAEVHLAEGGDRERAREPLREALALSREAPTRNPLRQAIASRLMAGLELSSGRLDEARSWIAQGLRIVESAEQDNLIEQAHLHHLAGRVALSSGAADEAKRQFAKAAERYQRITNRYHLHANHVAWEHASEPLPIHERPVEAPRPVEANWKFMRNRF